MQAANLSILHTGRLYLQKTSLVLIFVTARAKVRSDRFMSIKNSNDLIGNRIRKLQDFSAVPQPNVPQDVTRTYLRAKGTIAEFR